MPKYKKDFTAGFIQIKNVYCCDYRREKKHQQKTLTLINLDKQSGLGFYALYNIHIDRE